MAGLYLLNCSGIKISKGEEGEEQGRRRGRGEGGERGRGERGEGGGEEREGRDGEREEKGRGREERERGRRVGGERGRGEKGGRRGMRGRRGRYILLCGFLKDQCQDWNNLQSSLKLILNPASLHTRWYLPEPRERVLFGMLKDEGFHASSLLCSELQPRST